MKRFLAIFLCILMSLGMLSCNKEEGTTPTTQGGSTSTTKQPSGSTEPKEIYEVTGKTCAWYFLRALRNIENARPWVAYSENGRTVVSIPGTTTDYIWQTIDTTDTSDDFVSSRADMLITKDGKDGEIIRVLESGGYPILVTHWQSLMSNGLGTGIRVLEEIAKRVNSNLSDRVEWKSFEEIMYAVLNDKESYPKRNFL